MGVLSFSFRLRLVLLMIQYGQKITTSLALLAKSICKTMHHRVKVDNAIILN